MGDLQLDCTDFDVVVIGTGLVESVVAAAAARAGRSVLQLDPCDHYGGSWASLHLEEMRCLLTAADTPGSAAAAAGVRGAQLWHRPGADLGPPRQYSLDLAPKVAYGAGPLIQLLLGSGAHHYMEFKLLQGSYLADASSGALRLRSVPSCRSEVFKDRQLSPVQKRSLMRFLKAAAEALEGEGPLKNAFGAHPVEQLLEQQGLDEQLRQSLLHGVLLADDSSAAGGAANPAQQRLTGAQALDRLRVFVHSVGRYGTGTGPFLTPMYGCGELPQAFARVAAVAGAVQVLHCGVTALSFDEHTFSCNRVELASGQTILCRQLAAHAAALEEWLATFHPSIAAGSTHRCCAVLDQPLVLGEQHSMAVVLPAAAGSVVRALTLSSSTVVCPPGKHLLYLWVDAGSSSAGSSGVSSSSGSVQPAAVQALLPTLAALANTSGLQPGSSDGGDAASSTAAPVPSEHGADAGFDDDCGSNPKPTVLWAAFYTQDTRQLLLLGGGGAGSGSEVGSEAGGGSGRWPANVALCPGPDSSATFVSAVEAAKQCYWQLFPPAAAREDEAAAAAAVFPLDPGHTRAGPEGGDDEDDAAAAAAAPPAGDADSDEEAVAVMQAALRQVSTAAHQEEEGPGAA